MLILMQEIVQSQDLLVALSVSLLELAVREAAFFSRGVLVPTPTAALLLFILEVLLKLIVAPLFLVLLTQEAKGRVDL
jgi:hypothetical protein